jgi:hypothetical protein
MINIFTRANLVATYCLKSRTILKSWPKIRVYLLSNNYWVIFSKTKEFSVGPIFLVSLVTQVFPIEPIDPIAPIDLVDSKNRFLVSKSNFLLDLTRVYILA